MDGAGTHPHWNRVPWIPLQRLLGNASFSTRVKFLYSDTGFYTHFDCEDRKLSCTFRGDFVELFREDVVEIFLWPDPSTPLYFEYELSPLNHELPLLVPNLDGRFGGWLPWRYQGGKTAQHRTAARGGPLESGATVTGWSAECFLPYALLHPLRNVPPGPGTLWRANFYRMDYDDPAGVTRWAWQPVKDHFHEPARFGTLGFAPRPG